MIKALKIIFIISLGLATSSTSKVNNLESVMVVSGLRTPFYNELGELTAELIGARAYMLDANHADIEHLKIDLYEQKKVITSIYLPKCKTFTYTKNGKKSFKIISKSDVLIEYDQITIIGKGFEFDPVKGQCEIMNDVCILAKSGLWDKINVGL